jgi:phosphate transport system substrate-binding protein
MGKAKIGRTAVIAFALAISGFSLLLLRAEGTAPGPKRLLLFVGSNTLGERAIPELARAYLVTEKQASNVEIHQLGETFRVTGTLPDGSPVYIEIHATGSGDCFKSFLGQTREECDIGMASRRVTQRELAALKTKTGSDFTRQGPQPGDGCEHPVGMDGIAIITHRNVPISRIAFSELRAIYSKKLTDWSETSDWKNSGLTGPGQSIAPIRRKEPSGTLDFFKEHIKPDAAAMTDLKQIPAFVSSTELVENVASTPGAVGFVGLSYAQDPRVKRIQLYDDLPPASTTVESASFPDPDTVRQETYPLARVVYLYTTMPRLNPEVTPFLKFALGEQGQSLIADSGALVKVEGTLHELAAQRAKAAGPVTRSASPEATAGRKTKVILRLSGSNTVGAECAVNLAFNFLMSKRQNLSARIEDRTIELETPEGEKALAHDIMCDCKGDGVWQTIEIRPTGSSDAFRDLRDNHCDVGMASRPISESEKRDLLPICGNLSLPAAQFALGLDGLAIIVSNANRVDKLTVEQVRRIFLGEIKDWSEIGGDKLPIQLHSRPDRSGTYKHFCDSILLGRMVPASAKRHPENSLIAEAVAADPAAIGFVPMSRAGQAKVLRMGQEGSDSYYKPTEETVRDGQYPPALCRYVYLYVPATPPNYTFELPETNWQTAREFAEMTQSWRGQVIVGSSGFVTETAVADEAGRVRRVAGENVQQFLQRLTDLEKQVQLQKARIRPRLIDDQICPRLLFDFNESTLTAKSRNVIERKLGPWLKVYPDIATAGLIAEGWSDSIGKDDACLKVSLKRAESVARYIEETLGCKVKAVGMGKSVDPPNNNELNKQQNRRVVIKAAATVPAAAVAPKRAAAAKVKVSH